MEEGWKAGKAQACKPEYSTLSERSRKHCACL